MSHRRGAKPHGEIRQSQVIMTFGPGAMLDLPNHSVLVAGLDFWSKGGDEISEPRLTQKLAQILEVPSVRLLTPPTEQEDPAAPSTGIDCFQFPEWFSPPPPTTTSLPQLGINHRGGADMSEIASTLCVVGVEGPNDVEFLRRISRILHAHDSRIPDLDQLETSKRIVFVPTAAGPAATLSAWRSAGCRQFHLLDREMPPVDQQRERLVESLNQCPQRHAVLTSKRTIENYLHPAAIFEASGLNLTFGDFDDVPSLAAMAKLAQGSGPTWEALSSRARRCLRNKAKKWLNREAVDRMTPDRLYEQDRLGEVQRWLTTIAALAGVTAPHSTSVR
jgi:hypothetical protein